MKRTTITIAFVAISTWSFAQNLQDSSSSPVFYVSPMFGFYTNSGTYAQRSTPDIELGLQWDVFSVGLDIGKVNLGQKSGRDTTTYFEIRPNLNVFQQDKFTNTLTIGIGYVPHAEENILTEFTTGIEFTPNLRWSYNLFFGTYFFSGIQSARNQNFFGLSAMYYFLNRKRMRGVFNR